MNSLNDTRSWKRQCTFYKTAEVQRYYWLIGNPVVARAEARLLGSVLQLGRGTRMLEVGCGEGANLTTLRRLGVKLDYVGFDYFADEIEYQMEEPSTFFRLLLHYRYGFPGLGRVNAVAGLLEKLRGWCARRSNKKRWAYSVVRMVKRS